MRAALRLSFSLGLSLTVAALCAPLAGAAAAPSTFGPVIGSALLCRSHIENRYLLDYVKRTFGPSYKHEGGAYWFRTEARLWGAEVTDIIVSDDSSALVFVGAVTKSEPEKLEQAIRVAVGVRHYPKDRSAAPVRESSPGSKIVYFKTKSKIFCAKYKHLLPG